MYRISFNRPYATGREQEYIEEALRTMQISAGGDFTRRCEELLREVLGAPSVLLTTSCTHALEMAALLLDLKPGDEFIVPSFAFVTTASAFALRGARPVFVDIREDTLNLDEAQLEGQLSARTRAIVALHYGGVACEMDPILELSSRHGIPVVEDNAHGFLGGYRGRFLGTMGRLGTLSFHETKNITCGEGGALIVNDWTLADRAEILRDKGTDRSRFLRGQVDRYSWKDLGSSWGPSELLAAFLFAQLEERRHIQSLRRAIWDRYHEGLAPWAERNGVRLPVVPAHCEQAHHLFYLLLPDLAARGALIRHLEERGINSIFHYVPLHSSTAGRALGGGDSSCPVTEDVSSRLLRLPFYNALTPREQREVIEGVTSFSP